jgi:hypothetical protein
MNSLEFPDTSPPILAEETFDLLQCITDTTDLLGELSDNGQLTEDEAFNFMSTACSQLKQLHIRCNTLNNDWLQAAKVLDPEENLAGFIAWDGIEPVDMQAARIGRKELERQGRALSDSLISFAIYTYVDHHVEDDAIIRTRDEQAMDLSSQIASALGKREEMPLDEKYREFIRSAISLYPFKTVVDPLVLHLKALQTQREEFDPTNSAAKLAELDEQARDVHHKIMSVWQEMFNGDTDFDESWQEVFTELVSRHGLTDDGDEDARLLINDAVRLVAKGYALHQRLASSAFPDLKAEDVIYDSVHSEEYFLAESQRILLQSEQFESRDLGTEMLHDLRPRLKDAIIYLLRNAYIVKGVLKSTGNSERAWVYAFETFWEKALFGPPQSGHGIRGMTEFISSVPSITYGPSSPVISLSQTVSQLVANKLAKQINASSV